MSTRTKWGVYLAFGVLGLLALWTLAYNYTTGTPAAGAAGGKSTNWSWLYFPILGVPLLQILIVCVIGLVLLKILGRVIPGSGWTPSAKIVMRILTVFLTFTVLNAALYLLDPTVPLFTTPEGYGHLAFYAALFVIAAMIDANLEGKTKLVALVMLFITFALIGPRTGMLLSPDGKLWSKLHLDKLPSWSGISKSEPVFLTATQCGVEIPTPVVVSSSATLLTTGVKCDFDFKVVVGTVRVEGDHGRGYMTFGPTGLLEKNIYPGWRGVTIRSVESGTKITGKFL